MDAMIQFLMDATMENYEQYKGGLDPLELEVFHHGMSYGLALASRQLTETADRIGLDSDDPRAELLVDEIEKIAHLGDML